jgi:hypothetical protein
MTNVIQITQLPAAIALNGTEALEAVQAGGSVQVSVQQIANYVQSQAPVAFSALPSAAGSAGLRRFINNCSTLTFNAAANGFRLK